METYELWARVGVTIRVKAEDAQKLADDHEGFISEALQNGTAEVDGDTYFPSEVEENVEYEKRFGVELTSE